MAQLGLSGYLQKQKSQALPGFFMIDLCLQRLLGVILCY
jgi:hypothetical protein